MRDLSRAWLVVAPLVTVGCALAWLALPASGFSPAGTALAPGSPGSRVLEEGLVVAGVQVLDEGQQAAAAEEARLSSPALVAARERSRTEFERLSEAGALSLSRQEFPGLVDDPAGGGPRLPRGQRLVRYTSDDSAQVLLAGDKHGVIESLWPMATEVSPGHRVPVDLALGDVEGGFAPRTPVTRVHIPRRLEAGVALADSGVSLTPVNAQGRALAGAEGRLDGASVMYVGTQRDTDILAKPTVTGFELDSLLRSVESPQALYFRVGLPAGGRLVAAGRGSGAARVMVHNAAIAFVAAPSARDAEGLPVPVRMSVAGDVLSVVVHHRVGDYGYPVVVDPTVEENVGGKGEILLGGTWGFYNADAPKNFKESHPVEHPLEDEVLTEADAPLDAGDFASFYYRTQGESKIYSLSATTMYEGEASSRVLENVLGILNVHSGKLEAQSSWIGPYGETTSNLCSEAACATGTVSAGVNSESEALFKQNARENASLGMLRGHAKLFNAEVGIVQEAGPSAAWDTTDETIKENGEGGGKPNAMYPGTWVGNALDYWAGLNARDPGVGISRVSWSSPNAPGWGEEVNDKPADGAVQMHECEEAKCGGYPQVVRLGELHNQAPGLPNGEDTIDGTVEDAAGLKTTVAGVVKLDETAPHNISLVGLPPNNELGFGRDRLAVTASQGSGSTPSSGIAWIRLSIDGKEIGGPNGSCPPGPPCTATGEWEINGEEYAAGKHEVYMEAESHAGLKTEAQGTITFVSSESKAVGPGSVNLASGAFTMTATDVALASPGTGLSVERSYDSRLVSAGTEGPLGPQWQGLSFGGNEDLTKLPTGSVILTASSGQHSIFTREGNSFVPPTGDANLTLKEDNASAFTLSDQHGDVTKFTIPEGGTGTTFTPASREEPGHAGTTTYAFQTVTGVTEPTLALAPPPAGVHCTTLVRGCRALTFSYATKTSAGEAPSEWGEYAGRLLKVNFTAYNPASKEMQTTAVAQYAYDRQGRLRAEWDPRISPALKTTYGYDPGGHITAVTQPGEQPWVLHYGTTEGDTTGGRLLSVSRPSASTPLAQSSAPANEQAPKLSSTKPVVGTELSVSPGSWSDDPLAYSYQWQRCNSSGAECEPIAGATNQTYTPRYGDDEGHTFVALVTATNAGGSATSASAASTPLAFTPAYEFPRTYAGAFGAAGTKAGDFEAPSYIAYSGCGDLLVTDTGNDRVDEFGTGREYKTKFGTAGAGPEEFEQPMGIAALELDPHEVWIADSGNQRIAIYTFKYSCPETPEYTGAGEDEPGLRGVGADQSALSAYVANDTSDVVECYGSSSLQSECGETFGSVGSGPGQFNNPADVASNSVDHEIYVLDTGDDRVEYFKEGCRWGCLEGDTHPTEYLGAFGEAGSSLGKFKEPEGIAIDPWGHVWVADTGNDRLEEFTATGEPMLELGEPDVKIAEKPKEKKKEKEEREATERAPEHFNKPVGIVFTPSDNLYAVDSGNDRVQEWYSGEKPAEPPLPPAATPTTGGDAVWTIDYDVPIEGSGAPYPLGSKEVATLLQQDDPVQGTAIFPPDEPMGWPAKDYRRASIFYLDSKDRTVNVASPGGGIGTTEYNAENDVTRTLSADNRARAIKEGTSGADLATVNTYNSEGTELQSTIGPEHAVTLADGEAATARKIGKYSYDEGAPSEGGPYALVTKQTSGALDMSKSEEEEDARTTTTSYSGQEDLGWKLRKPTSSTADAGALNLIHTTLYEGETGNVMESREPANPAEKSPHSSETVYYATGANTKLAACGEHPEWAELPCQTRPGRQPETAGLPGLPATTTTYNIWDEPEKSEETVETNSGMVTRTKTDAYDAAGRLEKSATSSTVGAALPPVIEKYSAGTGALASQSSEGTSEKLTSEYNTLGQLTSYTDADGNTTTYTYDIDGRPETIDDGKGSQTYGYDSTTGELTKLTDSSGLEFTASYDLEGRMLTEGYPNGMAAKYSYNQVGEPVGLEYVKTTGCTSECIWYSDTVVPSIEGQWMTQTSTLASEKYTYDGAGRLSQVQDTPAGKSCTTHIYTYDEDGDRTSLTTRPPKSTGKCATKTKGQTVESHSYDEADRLIDPGIAYNPFGDITTLPASDAGGSELTNAYYVDNQLQSMTQRENQSLPEETIGYELDPDGRIRETGATGKLKTSTTISHYPGPGDSPSWTANSSGNEWSRNIPGINGQLAAIQDNGETPMLQLTNLHGDVIATAYLSGSATGLASTINEASEYGVPATEAPPKYSWLGALELPAELPSGVTTMGARSYIPQLGRFLQPDPYPAGSPNAYTYTFGDPLNETDPTGDYAEYQIGGPSAAFISWAAESSAAAAAQQAAENAAARAAAERAAQEAQAELYAAYGPLDGWEEWEEWEYEEEGGYEEVADRHSNSGGEQPRIEPAILVQPLGEEASGSEAGNTLGSVVPLCVAGSDGPCGRDARGKVGERCGSMYGKPCHHTDYKVRIRNSNGSWTKTITTYCGFVGGAFLTPGVDIFGAPAEIGCAGYGVYKAVEAIIENL